MRLRGGITINNLMSKESVMEVKIFTNTGDAPKMEKEINKWLSDSKTINVKFIKQSYSYDVKDDVFCAIISIWYEN